MIATSLWLFVLRIIIGATMLIHGYPKLKDGAKSAGAWMKSMGIPPFTAALAMLLEVIGGIALILGVLTPLASILFAIFMVSNIVMKKTKINAVYVSTEKPSYEVDVLYLVIFLTIFIVGAGQYSLDAVLRLPWPLLSLI